MKRILLVLTAFMGFSFATAQDTVDYMDSCYLFNVRHPFESRNYCFVPWDVMCCSRGFFFIAHDTDFVFRYNTPTSDGLVVYGVALTADTNNLSIDKYNFEVNLAQLRNDSLFFVDSTGWKTTDARAFYRYTQIGDGQYYEQVVPVFELYFDTPRVVFDTFFVGYRCNTAQQMRLYMAYDSSTTYYISNAHNVVSDCTSHTDSTYSRPLPPGVGIWETKSWWGTLFPIIQPNRHCGVPAAPRLTVYNATNTVRFTLPYSPGDSLLLSIADFGQAADSGTIYPVTDSILEIVIPDSGRYSARLGRICPRYGGLMLQSDWSTPTNFFIMSNLDIAQPQEGDAVRLLLFPNPASGTVTVGGFEGEGSVEIVDMAGRVSGQWPVAGGQRTIDISRLPAGSYVVRLTTAEGTASRMLQVE